MGAAREATRLGFPPSSPPEPPPLPSPAAPPLTNHKCAPFVSEQLSIPTACSLLVAPRSTTRSSLYPSLVKALQVAVTEAVGQVATVSDFLVASSPSFVTSSTVGFLRWSPSLKLPTAILHPQSPRSVMPACGATGLGQVIFFLRSPLAKPLTYLPVPRCSMADSGSVRDGQAACSRVVTRCWVRGKSKRVRRGLSHLGRSTSSSSSNIVLRRSPLHSLLCRRLSHGRHTTPYRPWLPHSPHPFAVVVINTDGWSQGVALDWSLAR